MSWPQVRISEVTEIVSGATPKTEVSNYWGGQIAWATPADLSGVIGTYINDTPRKITEAGLRSCSTSVLPANSVLFSSRAPIGHVAINTVPMATNQGFKSFVPDTKVLNAKFLFWWLKAHRKQLEAMGSGATFKEVSKATVSRVEIPLPPLDEQKRIAAILDKADQLRQKRRQAIALLEEAVDATFWHSYSRSAQKTQAIRFSDIATAGSGNFGNGPFGSDLLTSELRDSGVPVIYIRDIRDGEYKRVSSSFVTETKAKALITSAVLPGDVLISKVGDPPGVAAIYPDSEPDGIVTQDVIRIRVNEAICLKEYLRSFLNSSLGKHLIKGITVAATRARFSLTDLKSIEIPLPSVAEQAMFATCVASLEREKKQMELMLIQSDSLFSSLQHRTFSGQL